MKRIAARRCSTIAMVAGEEKRTSMVIDGDSVKEWVGIGWITLRKATREDRKKIPIVERSR